MLRKIYIFEWVKGGKCGQNSTGVLPGGRKQPEWYSDHQVIAAGLRCHTTKSNVRMESAVAWSSVGSSRCRRAGPKVASLEAVADCDHVPPVVHQVTRLATRVP